VGFTLCSITAGVTAVALPPPAALTQIETPAASTADESPQPYDVLTSDRGASGVAHNRIGRYSKKLFLGFPAVCGTELRSPEALHSGLHISYPYSTDRPAASQRTFTKGQLKPPKAEDPRRPPDATNPMGAGGCPLFSTSRLSRHVCPRPVLRSSPSRPPGSGRLDGRARQTPGHPQPAGGQFTSAYPGQFCSAL